MGPRRQGGGDQLPNFYHVVLTIERVNVQCRLKRLNVTTTTKKVINVLGKKSAPPEKKCTPKENPGYAYEKRPAPYVGMGPRVVIRPAGEAQDVCQNSQNNYRYFLSFETATHQKQLYD